MEESEFQPLPLDPEPIACPSCGQPIPATPDPNETLIECPRCGNQFFPTVVDDTAESDEPEVAVDRDAELNALRIQQISRLRRSSIRSRSHAIIAMVCCVVVAGQLVVGTWHEVRMSGWDMYAMLYGSCCVLTMVGAVFSLRKALILHREAKAALPVEPEIPPHFEELSDGSQHARHLEEM